MKCHYCGGEGYIIIRTKESKWFNTTRKKVCPKCNGRGELKEDKK